MFSRILRPVARAISTRATPKLHCPNALPFRPNAHPKLPNRTSIRQSSTSSAAKDLFRKHPVHVTLAMTAIGCGAAALLYSTYIYIYFIEPINMAFPEPVANKLRRALYYSNVEIDLTKAMAYYKQALTLADDHKISPFSDEIIGIKLTVAGTLEKHGSYESAINVMEQIKADILRWVETFGGDEGMSGHRNRLLQKTVGVNVKLGELYSNPYIDDLGAAEKSLIQGVETVLIEMKRREKVGVKEEEGEWMSEEQIGGALEALAHHYEEKSQHSLATPLFLRALTMSPPPCHAVVLMNNVAISLSQTSPDSSLGAPTSRAALIGNAKTWAEKALSFANGVKSPEKTEECNIGCAVAMHNLGEFAEMEGLVAEARQRYTEASGLAKAAGFQDGVQQAENSLRRLVKLSTSS